MHFRILLSLTCISAFAAPLCFAEKALQSDFSEMSFDELMQVEVTSVSKKAEKLSKAAAAAYVVTSEEIRRSGATSIPEALRLVPGVDAAQVDPNKWAVGIRGFNGQFTNKLLVMIDGQSVYTPTFSGVFWENFDYSIADIERIEVIRGPGATLWGANAVNGVINIITREAYDENRAAVAFTAGNEIKHIANISGDYVFSDAVKARAYAKSKQLDGGISASGPMLEAGRKQHNDAEYKQLGGRIDWQISSEQWLTVQADLYRNDINQEHTFPLFESPFMNSLVEDTLEGEGAKIQARWHKITGLDSELQLQFSYDYYDRVDGKLTEHRDTANIEFQHQFAPRVDHEVVWGGGVRWSETEILPSLIILQSVRDDVYSWNLFAQDTVTFPEQHLSLTAGVKIDGFENGDSEVQPNVRASWQPNTATTLWGAISRAKRTPSFAETQVELILETSPPVGLAPLPTRIQVNGQSEFGAEQVDAYELGWRWQAAPNLAFDVAAFYNEYSDLRNYLPTYFDPSAPPIDVIGMQPFIAIDLESENSIEGHSQGVEVLARWQASESAQYRFVYSYIDTELEDKLLGRDSLVGASQISADEDRSPNHLASIWGAFDLADNVELDVRLFYSGERSWVRTPVLQEFHIDSQVNADVRLSWRASEHLELSLVGRNLLKDEHQEFISESWPVPTQIERSAFLKAVYAW